MWLLLWAHLLPARAPILAFNGESIAIWFVCQKLDRKWHFWSKQKSCAWLMLAKCNLLACSKKLTRDEIDHDCRWRRPKAPLLRHHKWAPLSFPSCFSIRNHIANRFFHLTLQISFGCVKVTLFCNLSIEIGGAFPWANLWVFVRATLFAGSSAGWCRQAHWLGRGSFEQLAGKVNWPTRRVFGTQKQ